MNTLYDLSDLVIRIRKFINSFVSLFHIFVSKKNLFYEGGRYTEHQSVNLPVDGARV